ncbi:MAG: hypothetical protein M1496_01780 [Candidatus Thermoplasmatota archaeon]|jgi:hypothetical protein|nr:hypothetical protein [Candidatus Thermoplasmatota archaeon]
MDSIDSTSGMQKVLNTGPDSNSIASYYLLIGIGVLITVVPIIGLLGYFIVFIAFILLFLKRHAMGDLQRRLLTFDIVIFIVSLIVIMVGFVAIIFTTIFSQTFPSGSSSSSVSPALIGSILGDLMGLAIAIEIVPFGICYLLMGVGIVEDIERRIFSLLILAGIAVSVIGTYISISGINITSIVQNSSNGTSINSTGTIDSGIYGSVTPFGIARVVLIGVAFIYLWKVVKEGHGDIQNITSLGSSGEPY